MATIESQKRSERRRAQKWWERLNRDPEVIALRREIARRQRYLRRHPYAGQPTLAYMHCVYMGIQHGGRPPKARRCTRRLGTRYCWNWRAPGTDRCDRHGRRTKEHP
jgi:hypothetical protein